MSATLESLHSSLESPSDSPWLQRLAEKGDHLAGDCDSASSDPSDQCIFVRKELEDLESRLEENEPYMSPGGNKRAQTSRERDYRLEIRALNSLAARDSICIRQELRSLSHMASLFPGIEKAHCTLADLNLGLRKVHLRGRSGYLFNTGMMEVFCLLVCKVFFPPVNWILLQSLCLDPPGALDRNIVWYLPQLDTIIDISQNFRSCAWILLFLLEIGSITALLAVGWNFRNHNRTALYLWSTMMVCLTAIACSRNGVSASEYFLIGLPLSVSVGMTWASLHRGSSPLVRRSIHQQASHQSTGEQCERGNDMSKNTTPTTMPEPIYDEFISTPSQAPLNSVAKCA